MNPSKQQTSTPADPAGAPADAGTVKLLPHKTDAPAFLKACHLTANSSARANARIRVRTWLTMGRWAGNVDQASRVAGELVDNAVSHGRPFPGVDGLVVTLRVFAFADTGDLAIEVDDALASFLKFAEVANQSGEARRNVNGLWWVAHYRGRLSWDVKRDVTHTVIGKTGQALLPQTWGGAA
ncbi:hypothetical protein [Streptomyces sp. NPDC058108]|uniref:hypothetical protein n=1 Tax=Streptomyces sp. NPDC058108 TaxID=3346344 RepID=UPI0036ECBD6E